jgi:Uncharacterized protein conserved in bacteria (DUF2066)
MKIMRLDVKSFLVWLYALAAPAFASGPVETSPFAVQGVSVDVTDTNAAVAKDKAIIDVQLKAFTALVEKLGSADAATEAAKMDAKTVVPMLKSLSIEEEKISPGHYQGTFTVRFLPDRVKPVLSSLGISLPASQGPAMLVIPVWNDGTTTVLWEDNPWRKAWQELNAQQAQIPIIIPLGDQDEASSLSPQDAVNNDPIKLEALRRRYDVKTLLVAYAEPAEGGGIHVRMTGKSPLGKITIDKNYSADSGTLHDSALLGAQRVHKVMIDKFQADLAKVAAAKAEQQAAANSGQQSVAVLIPFDGPSQWNGLRSRIISTPGILGVDLTSLQAEGAQARLLYSGTLEDMQASLQSTGLQLRRSNGGWVVVPL